MFPLLVLISIRFLYLDHLVANRMPTSMCPNPVERDGVVGFKQFCAIFQHISTVYVVFIRSAYFFFKCCMKPTCLSAFVLYVIVL